MSSRKSRSQIGFSMKERILARIMILVLTVSMIPYQTFAADPAVVKTVKSIEDIRTKYEVDHGTTLDKIGLPSSLSAVIETTRLSDGNTDEEPESTEETVQEDIRWEGKYDGNSAGKYKLEARFEDKDLVYKDMPVVTVTVREPESGSADEPDQSENQEKPDQSEKQDKSDKSEPEDERDQSENQDESDQSENEDEPDQFENEDKPDQSEKEDEQDQSRYVDKADQPEKEDKAAQSEDADEAGQSRSTDEEDKPETEAVKDIEQNADSNVRMEKTEKRFADEPVDEPFADEPVDEPSGDSNSFTTPAKLAEQLYGENGTARTFTVTLKDDKHNTSPNDVTRAGNNIGYNINVSMQAAAVFKYDGCNSEPMFSEWKNIRIYLKLPENVRFTEIKTQGVADHFTQIDAENNIWEIVLTRDHRDATNANSINLDINARVEGNGELPDGTVLGEAEVTFSADFDVRINEDWTTKTYSKTVTDTTDKITLSTPDEWILTKSPYEPPKNYTIDKSKDPATVTVHYLIKYGLNVNDVPTDDENVYTRPGRVPYEKDIKLTDTPTLTLHDGRTLSEISMTVTPAGTGYVYKGGSSADEGDNPKAITVQPGTETVLPYAVVGSNSKGVAETAPAYSEYNVDVVYPYDEFMIWYYENVSRDDAKATAENEAKISYQLHGQNTVKETREDDADTTVPGYIPPGNIKIEKYIVNYDSDSKNLYTAAKDFVTGPATFEVCESDGTTPAVLWYKDAADNNKFKKITSGNVVTVDPAQAKSASNGNEGWIDFYLDAGTYVIKETGRPAYTEAQGSAEKTITVNEDGTVTASFDNKEKLGEVKVKKIDDSNKHLPVPGAVFGLYRDRQHTQPVKDAAGNELTATTNNSGEAAFKSLVPGTYYLWEISAPQGYIKSDEVKEVTVTANNTSDDAVQVTNHLNKKEIELLKQYSTVADPNNYTDVTDDYRKFANAFVLQRCAALNEEGTSWTEWEDVSTHSIGNKGGTSIKVAEYDSQNRKLKYRFMETIPSDYFDLDGNPGNGSNKAYSDEIIPANGTILDPQNKIVMKNRKGGFIELTKKKVELNVVSGKYTEAAGGDKEFRLYRVAAGNNIAEAVDTGTTDANGKLTFSGLVSADARGRIYTYYVVEQNPDTGYTWITDSKITIGGTETDALSVGSFTAQSGGTLTPVTYNVKQEIRLGVIKKDRFSDSTQLAGAKFEISDESGKKQTVTTKNSGAVYAKIDLGHVYTITETEVPVGYYKDAQPQSIDTRGWHVEMENGNYKIVKSDGTEVTEEDLVYTFADTPYQKIRLQKKVRGENETDAQAKKLSGVTFSVYVRENNAFVPVKDANGNTVTIKADGTSAVSLPEGEYYLHEDTKAEGVAYPDDLPDLYTGKGEYSGGKFYFGSYEVKKPAQSQDTMIDLDAIVNIYNKGDLIVTKKLFDKDNKELTGSVLNGFSMDVYKADENGNPVGNAIKRAVTGQGVTVDGQAIFKDLPVYDENGNKIHYVVKEVYTGGQADIYYSDNMVSSKHPVLISGGTADAGYIENHQYMSVDVVKKYYNARDYELTGLKYELEGAEIALYQNNGDGTYTYLTTGVTDKNGQVSFGKLKFSADGFVAIEVSIPDREEYKYMVPVEGDYLQKIDGSCPPTLTQAEVDTLSKAALTSATDPKYTGEIDNEIPWTQIHVTKYDEGKQTKLDGADFTLYKQVLPKGTDGGELTFDAANCTVVGQYTSGTWIHNYVAQTGEFQTDILENADNVVYWLVEDKAPAGYTIKDSENYVLFPNEGTNYTNNSNGGRSTKVYPGGLKKNTINYYDVENEEEIGPFELDNRAYIEFTKWMQKEETAGKQDLARSDFKLMPNATFELYAVNASDHNKVYLLDTITTGDENLVDGGPATGYGVSRALDAWQIFDEIERRFPDQREHIITFKSAADSGYDVDYPYVVGPDGKPIEDAQGNRTKIKGTFKLNAVLVEISGSSKYNLDLHDHNLQITFIPSSLSLGNDKYAVAELEHSSAVFCDEANDSSSVAIVDYLANNNSVVLRHFGYDSKQAGDELQHEALEALRSSSPYLFIPKEVSFSLERFNESTGKWEYWSPTTNKKIDSAESFKTDGNGYSFEEGLNPGEYRAVMTKPADDYENLYSDVASAFHFTVAVSDKSQVFTTYSPAKPARVRMIIDKEVDFGSVPARNYSFSFTLKDDKGNEIPAETGKDKAAGTVKSDGSIEKTQAVFPDLSQNGTYYLKENQADGYLIKEVKVNGQACTPEEGKYKIVIPETDADVSVTVTNTLLEGRVTILKYDGTTGEKLTGASFEVLKSDGKTVVSKAEVIDNGDGSYTAVIPLEGEGGETYFIHEVKAPEIEGKKYTIDEENASVKVEGLKPGQNLTYKFNGPGSSDNEYALPNYEGIEIEIVKYGGLPEASVLTRLKDARFQMYYKTSDGENWNTWHPAETTDEQGKAKFMILKGYDYAIAETNDVAGYVGLYGVYEGDTALTTDTSSDGWTLYVLGHSFENDKAYTYTGYSIPFLKLTVEKEDFSGTVQNPNVEFHVYEVPNGTKETLKEEEIDALTEDAEAANKYIEGKTAGSTYSNKQYIRPGKTYLAVEDHAIDGEGSGVTADDYSIIKEDSHVVYYKVFSVPEENYEDEYKVTFVNNKGSASVKLTKSVDKYHVDSLTIKEAELTYTLAPNTTNGYALDAFKLNDSGLFAEPSNATLSQEWYSINEVIVGQGKMDKYLKGATPDKDYAIFATVTFVGFDGTEYKENPVNVSEGNISVQPVSAGGEKIKSFYVEYSSPDLKTDTGYALGQNFKAGNTVVKATVFKQEKPEDGVVTAVKKIINNADVALTYTPSDSRGDKQEQKTLTAEDDAETVVDVAKAPKIKFSKTGPDQDVPVELGSSITYRLTVKNVTGEPLDFTDPIIVDLLPQGMVVEQDKQFVKVTDKPGTIADNPAVSTGYAGDSQYVNIVFDGTVGDGESITVELTATVTNAVTNYGTVMRNFAFTTSKEVGVATSDNATGAVIRDDDGLWASELVSIATALDCSSSRAQALKTALGEQGKYGYLADWHENNWVSDNQLVCVKAEYGPADGGVYRTDKVSVVVNDEDNADQRRMHYQLSINNLSPSKRTNLVVMDILPVVGDQRINNTGRGSNWPLYFDTMGSVMVNGQACSDYTVYYYSGDASELKADDIVTLITKAKTDCPDGWSTDKPAKATAFIVAFNYDPTNVVDTSDSRTVVLEGNKSVQIEYTALTDYREAEDLNKIVFTNAANDFNFGFSTFSPPSTADRAQANEPLGSNQVEVTIAPPKVKVGGDVWIDADDNGWQDDGDQSWYLKFDIVKQLIDDLGVKIDISNQKNFSTSETRDGSFTETGSGPDYGIAHFEFDELTAAKLRNNSTDYANWNDGTAGKLIGKNPYTYFVDIAYKGSTFAKTVNKVDLRGSYVPGSIPENDQKDDNFEGSAASVRTEQFFLHQTKDVFDMTKDIGYNLKRKLELTKVSRVDGKPVEGAEFTIYGPFVHDTGKDQELSDSKIAAVLTTGANGKAEKTGLQFFMEYVIVETGAVKGFGIEGALAEGTNIQKLEEGKWLLKVPGFKAAVPEDTGYVDAVTVRDPENIEVEVEKIWNDEEGAYSDRPLSIEVMLYTDEECTAEAKDADGNTVEKKILNKNNSWKAKWTDLPRYKVEKDSDGNETETEIVYYAKETLPAGKELKGYNVVIARDKETSSGKQSLTITNTPQTKGVKVQKVWAGELPSLDADERIVSVTFQVQRSVDPSDENSWENVVKKVKGVATDVTIVINRDETEARSVTGLPRNDPNGNAYSYRAVEIMMTVKDKDGATHDIDISGGAIGGYKVTEIHSAQEDGSDESEEDEDEPSEDEEFDTSTFTNTAVKGKLKPVKDWQDEGNRYGDRPTTIKIRIKAEGTDYFDYETIIELNAGNNWGEDLDPIEVPVMDVFGNKITYVITEILDDDKDKEAELLKKYVPTFEIETEGVEAKVTGEGVTGSTEITDGKTTTDTYTNTHKPVRTSVTASKIWNDQNNRNGERPETIEFTLFETYTDSEGNEKTEAVAEDDTGKAVTPKEVKAAEDGTWTVSWSDLAVYKKGLVGSRITYSVRETKINGIDVNQYYGYNIDENGLEVTNTPVETGLDVTKEWDDDGAEAAAAVTAATFRIERSVDGKTWSEMKQDGKAVTLTLKREADEVSGMGSVDGLPAYDMSSKPYMYRASETSITVDGKTVEVKDGKVGFYEVTETHTHGKDESDEMAVARDLSEIRNSLITTDFSVEKQFEGDSFGISKSVKAAAVKLQRRTGKAKWEDLKNPADAGSYELTAKDDWAHTWKDLPAYDQNGNAYQYRAVEVSITVGNKTHKVSYGEDETSGTVTAYEYSSSTEVSEEDGFTTLIVNKLRTGSLEVSKIWKDANDKSRPGSVKVSLVSNAAGKKISLKGVKSAATLNKDNKWTDQKTWAELPVYDAAGNKIVYSLEEPEIKKYTAAYKIAVKGSKDKEGKGTKLSTEISAGQTVKASFANTLNTSSSSSSVRTGDDTPLTVLIVMFALSMAGLAIVIWRRKHC